MKTTMLVLLGAAALTVGVAGAEGPFGMWCVIDGKELRLTQDSKAVPSPGGGVSLIAHNGRTWLCISVPKFRPGVQRLTDTPGLALDYNRDIFSSDSRSSYSARLEVPDTRLEVMLKRAGAEDGIVEGEFSADASSFPPGALRITKGKFSLRISDSQEQKGAQPGSAANRSQPVTSQTNRPSAAAGSGR